MVAPNPDRDPTFKQELFVQKYIELDGNGKQAAIEAGYSPNSAQAMAAENLAKPIVVKRLAEVANEIGLTTGRVLKTVNAALDANKALVVASEVTYEPDWNARMRASDLALKVHGLSDNSTTNNLNVMGDDFLNKLAETYYKKKSLENKDNLA